MTDKILTSGVMTALVNNNVTRHAPGWESPEAVAFINGAVDKHTTYQPDLFELRLAYGIARTFFLYLNEGFNNDEE